MSTRPSSRRSDADPAVAVDPGGRRFRARGSRAARSVPALLLVVSLVAWLPYGASPARPPVGPDHVSGTVDGWQHGAARLAARLPLGDVMVTVATGTVTPVGDVVLALPADVDPRLAEPLQHVVVCAAADATTTSVARLASLTVNQDGVEYDVALASSPGAVGIGGGGAEEARASYWYATQPALVHLACKEPAAVWDLTLRRGWNLVEAVLDGGGVNHVTTVESFPEAWRWYALDSVRLP